MRNLILALGGFLLGAAVVAAVALAGGSAPRPVAAPATTVPSAGSGMGSMMGGSGGSMMGSAAAPASSVRLTIQHVLRGCHVWSNGRTTGATMHVTLRAGQTLSIVDNDVDRHQVLELGGPASLRLGGPLMMSQGETISFPRKGLYRLGTRVVEMPGGGMDVKTIGPDNTLRLSVTVA